MKKRGIKANILVKSEGKNKKIIISEVLVTLATYGMAFIQFISLVFYLHLWHLNFCLVVKIIGYLFEIFGIFIIIKAMIDMNDSWRQGISLKQKTELVQNGIYAFSRNPAFFGFDLFYVGYCLSIPTYLQIFFTTFSVISLHIQILCEEESLVVIFGTEYQKYKMKTPRYFLV